MVEPSMPTVEMEQWALRSQKEIATLRAQLETVTRERDEARLLVTEANNSLYGSQNYFHSANGGAFDKHHLSRPIEELKASARKYSVSESALTAAQKRIEELEAGLAWYGEQARLARLIHSEGDAGRYALADDGGTRARALLSKQGGEG